MPGGEGVDSRARGSSGGGKLDSGCGSEDGGEVYVSWMLEQLGREPKLLDVIDVPLEGIVPLPDQPENWLMVRRAAWRDRGTLPVEEIPKLVDHPLQLWGTQKRDVEAGYVETMGEPASLYFIEPEVVGPVQRLDGQKFE